MASPSRASSGDGPPEPAVPLSALEHWSYCGRQAALILLEESYRDNADTVRGSLFHARVEEAIASSDGRIRQERSLPVFHDGLGLVGVCDVVEMAAGILRPVEFKAGPYVAGGPADVQLCGQVLCLEHMFGVAIEDGFVFSAADRRRHRVDCTAELRSRVEHAAREVRRLLTSLTLPAPVEDARCRRCSLRDACLPQVTDARVRHAERTLFAVGDE